MKGFNKCKLTYALSQGRGVVQPSIEQGTRFANSRVGHVIWALRNGIIAEVTFPQNTHTTYTLICRTLTALIHHVKKMLNSLNSWAI